MRISVLRTDSARLRSCGLLSVPPPTPPSARPLDGLICRADLDGFSVQIPNQNHNSSPPPHPALPRLPAIVHRRSCDGRRRHQMLILTRRSGDEWESPLLLACKRKPDLSAGSQRVALPISPTPLLISARYLLVCFRSIHTSSAPPPPPSTFRCSSSPPLTQPQCKRKKKKKTIIRGRNYFNILHWLMNIQCKQLFFFSLRGCQVSCVLIRGRVRLRCWLAE